MTMIEVGDLRKAHDNDKQLPKSGVVISADRKELRMLAKLLYKEVNVNESRKD